MKSVFTLFFSLCIWQIAGAQVKVSTTNSAPDGSAMLEVESSDRGFLPPRMADPQQIANPANGLQVFNTTTNCLQIFIQPGGWQNIYCGCSFPAAPAAGSHVQGSTDITWNWTAVEGATGYRYNTINDYATSTPVGATSFAETGLACGSAHDFYVWAINSCGPSAMLSLTSSTFACGPSPCAPGTAFGGGIVAHVSGTNPCTGLITTQETAPGTYIYTDAMVYCDNLSEGGYSDWFLPDITQLGYLRTNYAAIGGFLTNDDVYFSSTATFINQFGGYYNVSSILFPGGQTGSYASPSWAKNIRCVRAF